jgi:D-Tyr-tRNAtyr deacylase
MFLILFETKSFFSFKIQNFVKTKTFAICFTKMKSNVKTKSLLGKKVQTGQFGASMDLEIHNNGPVTIIIDSKNKI